MAEVSSSSPVPDSGSSAASVSSEIAASVSSAVLSSIEAAPSIVTVTSSGPIVTSVATVAPADPSTVVFTSLVTASPTIPGETPTPVVVVVTATSTPTTTEVVNDPVLSTTAAASSSSTAASVQPGASDANGTDGGLSAGGKTAVAVVVPVVAVALLLLGGLFLWRRRRQRQTQQEARRKEIEEYGINPNHDPTMPAMGAATGSEMTEDASGYRGWGNATTATRKTSTTLSNGLTQLSDSGNSGGYHSPGSPTQGTASDGRSGDPLVDNRRETMDSETIGALGAAPVASSNRADVRRGPSNASSSYSAGNRSDHSDPPVPVPNPQDYYNDNAYFQPGPYGDGPYGGVVQQPVIRDVSARRNTRIENPSVFPQQGNSGIAQNF
ncbi:hypothetical protein W97_01902 [Coniosporium apollinis CBS 100218]|uniref:Uncharacterized protein n=1 Tax=Coniosporium apollinis (strain CBS 100218) TaxID=1168221 RepID=R7YLC7_CONA1|nr:uncharacterized protein W97_01902 [Coniosporium apollinis CBS 100218]EON62678.1 hypothetical protein W97_01902 [Coniosporium apollinis CBS 100218]